MSYRGSVIRPIYILFMTVCSATACNRPLADRCYLPEDCSDGDICSNDGDRSQQGLCVPHMATGTSSGTDTNAETETDSDTDTETSADTETSDSSDTSTE